MPLQRGGAQPRAPSLPSGQENYTSSVPAAVRGYLSEALVSLRLSLMSRAWGEHHHPCHCFGLFPIYGKALPGLSLAQPK